MSNCWPRATLRASPAVAPLWPVFCLISCSQRRSDTVPPAPRPRGAGSHQPRLSERARLQLTSPQIIPLLPPLNDGRHRPFMFGVPALDAFPYQLWSQLAVRHARRISSSTFTYQGPAGYRPLREAIAAHITVSRRVHCTPEQIVIVPARKGRSNWPHVC